MTPTQPLRDLVARMPAAPWAVVDDECGYWRVRYGDLSVYSTAFDDGTACGEYSESCSVPTRDAIVALRNLIAPILDVVDAAAFTHAVLSAPGEPDDDRSIEAYSRLSHKLTALREAMAGLKDKS